MASWSRPAGAADENSFSNKMLFWASFFTLIAAGMGFAIRGEIMASWGSQFGLTQSELGAILGMGLAGFGVSIIFFSFFADYFGYGRLMVIAFLLHTGAAVLTLAAPFAYQYGGKSWAYWSLYLGQLCFSLANGTCEAVINPLTATLFPRNKTHWLNILHAGWPGGLVLGAVVSYLFNEIGGIDWRIYWGVFFAPVLLYGVMMVGRSFPKSEARVSGVSLSDMMGVVGFLGMAVVAALLGLYLSSDVAPSIGLPGWTGWIGAIAFWLAYSAFAGFRPGHIILTFLYIMHALVGYVELGTDGWIINITGIVLDKQTALIAFIWTNVLMFTLRFFAGPIVHKISPLGLLFASAVIGTVGLVLLGIPATNTTWAWIVAVSIYGLGKTFYWPTLLGVISERYPKGGALALGFSGGIGMLAAGLLGGPLIGYKQDYAATHKLQAEAKSTYERYKADEPRAPLPYLEAIAGIDNAKRAVLENDGKALAADLALLEKDGKKLTRSQTEQKLKEAKEKKQTPPGDVSLNALGYWWEDVKAQAESDRQPVKTATLHGGKQALLWTATVPAALAIGFLLLVIVFKLQGGYKQVHIDGEH